jgi:microcystin-dependent protein
LGVGKDRYLGITVDGQELRPRSQILPTASTAPPPAHEVGTTPPGSIVAYASERIPDGWLLCDGSSIPEGPAYERLREIFKTGKLPDLRGVFLRGVGQNADPAFRYSGDASREVLQFQADEFKAHEHRFDDFTFSENSGVPGKAWGSSGKSDIDNSPGSPFSHLTASSGGAETRPKNAAVYWMIKY